MSKLEISLLFAFVAQLPAIELQAQSITIAEATPENNNPSEGLSEVVVTAQKRTQLINDVGMSITATSADAL